MANRDRHEVAEVLRDAAATLGADLTRTARDTQEAARDLASAVRHNATAFGEDAADRMRTTTRAVRKEVRTHPVAWAAGAAGVGFLLGSLLTKRREHPPV